MDIKLNLNSASVSTQSSNIYAKTSTNFSTSNVSSNIKLQDDSQQNQRYSEQGLSTSAQLEKLSDDLNEQMKSLKADIEFGFSNEIGGLYIKVTDPKTGEVIRQIPSEEALKLQEYFKNAVGLLFNKES